MKPVLMLLSNAFDPDPRVYAEAKALAQNGYDVTLLAWDRDGKCAESDLIDGIRVRRIYISSTHGRGFTQAFVMVRVLLALIRQGRTCRFDAVHAHDFDTLPAGAVLSVLKRKPLVYDSHESYTGMLHGSVPSWMLRTIDFIETLLLRRVSLLITVGDKLRAAFEHRGCRRSVVVGNWKALKEFRLADSVRNQVRAELGIPNDALAVGFIANLGAERYIPELLAAVQSRPPVHLIIGGDGPAQQAVEQATQQSPNIHYLGRVKPNQIPRFTVAADVLYYGFDPDNPNAAFSAPNKLFEALAAGRAVMCANFGEIGKILAERDCGPILANYSVEEIVRALDECSEPQKLKVWSENAALAGDMEFNWANAELKLLQAYGELLGQEVEIRTDESAQPSGSAVAR